MVTFEEWESGKVKLKDEKFNPVFYLHPFLGRRLLYFVGSETGTKLSANFFDVLESNPSEERP